ncbi:hypothetical protein EV383_6007 [Pseudonocardia sediminis]|uniref:Uncharacterized protein n=1 Tax=Pseudonocardia sediminis TaxID=1397368 RepID=A0A4Q7V387_PSEST|nr:hypothetical protein [Pseudonocardia sediminis]RZT89052.1 hypothetical protein EV383_6007 [Pseudonocardia sediminis]
MTGRAAREWAVPERAARTDEIDPRLMRPAGRTDLLQVLVDHDAPAVGRCPGCGTPVLQRRDCPSRVIALCLLENKPFPVRLAHLVEAVPGARAGRDAAADRDAGRQAQDALPGLFEAPARRPETRRTQ